MESSLTIYPIRKDKLETVKTLITDLQGRKKESLETLTEAGIVIETIFIQGNSLFVYKVAQDIAAMKLIQQNSKHSLYESIRPVLSECLRKGYSYKPEGEFLNFPEPIKLKL